MKKRNYLSIITILILIFILFSDTFVKAHSPDNITDIENKIKYSILVDLNELRLYLINKDTHEIVKTYPIASGKATTPSPVGTWTVIFKEANWGKGFGSRWIALNVPWGKYGIHGTNKPLSIGGAKSSGCIRMFNKNVENLYEYVGVGTTVVIYGGPYGLFTNHFRNLVPGDRGSDVFEVQRKLKDIGYYSGKLDGIYSDDMKRGVVKFRKDNNLQTTHNINAELYNKLDMKPFE